MIWRTSWRDRHHRPRGYATRYRYHRRRCRSPFPQLAELENRGIVVHPLLERQVVVRVRLDDVPVPHHEIAPVRMVQLQERWVGDGPTSGSVLQLSDP